MKKVTSHMADFSRRGWCTSR